MAMSDTQLTQLLGNIKAQQPRVIGLEIYRLTTDDSGKNRADV
jgi:CHASE2 domain-containing sensor protein